MEPFRASRNASSFKTPDGRQGVEKRAGSLSRLLIMITVIAESLTFHEALTGSTYQSPFNDNSSPYLSICWVSSVQQKITVSESPTQ